MLITTNTTRKEVEEYIENELQRKLLEIKRDLCDEILAKIVSGKETNWSDLLAETNPKEAKELHDIVKSVHYQWDQAIDAKTANDWPERPF